MAKGSQKSELNDREAEQRFEETVRRMLNTPPKPHEAPKPKAKRKKAKPKKEM
jgi:hypothetical protein